MGSLDLKVFIVVLDSSSQFFLHVFSTPKKRCVLGNWLADFLAMLPAPERYLDVGAARSSHQYLEVHPPSPGPIL